MSLKLEIQTGFAVGCSQEEGEEQAGRAKLGSFLTWLCGGSLPADPGLLCSPDCPSSEQCSRSFLHWKKEFSWSLLKWILLKIQSGSRKKEKPAFEALILLTGVDYYKSHAFNSAATCHTFHFALMEGLNVKTRKKGGTAPGWGICDQDGSAQLELSFWGLL